MREEREEREEREDAPAGRSEGREATGNGMGAERQSLGEAGKKRQWLLFLRHCAKCTQSDAECPLKARCSFGKRLWHHVLHCAGCEGCEFPRCQSTKELLKHHQMCQVGVQSQPCV